ncbi:hypothetical protein PG994_010444 [Apiospora phragmitis]|uniref:Uncharacterized protein n=1 Tax=Apiospora phragmitis TaxID=2905665 RepID=A0ABR1TQ17_9PEZI
MNPPASVQDQGQTNLHREYRIPSTLDSDGSDGSDGGDIEGALVELVDIVLEITEQALGSNYSGSGSGTFVGGNFLSPTIVIDPNYQNGQNGS